MSSLLYTTSSSSTIILWTPRSCCHHYHHHQQQQKQHLMTRVMRKMGSIVPAASTVAASGTRHRLLSRSKPTRLAVVSTTISSNITSCWIQNKNRYSDYRSSSSGIWTTTTTSVRFHSTSSRGKGGGGNFKLDALPFSVSPEEALEKWRQWAEDDQNLKYILNYNSIRIGAAYCPVWAFDLNIRFPQNSMPPSFQSAFGGNSATTSPTTTGTIHLPGLAAYAGYSYRRLLVNPVHSTSLVFLGDQTEPFGGWMLRDMKLQSTGAPISIIPDAWNATEGRALQLVRHDLQALVDAAWKINNNSTEAPPKVQLQVTDSRRVYMPTFVIDYKILGLEYRAFVSGCDQGAAVAGVSHQILGDDNMFFNPEYHQAARNFLARPFEAILNRPTMVAPFLGRLLTAAWFLFVRVWAKIPIIGLLAGSVAGYRKVYQPWMDNNRASAEWERQRENEANEEEEEETTKKEADFMDTTGAQNYFYRNRGRILNNLAGETEHEQGQYGWFEEWQEWSRKQWDQAKQQGQRSYYQQQQQQQQSYQQQQQQQQTSSSGGGNRTTDYHWDFDPNDPYSVLGLSRTCTKEQASQAFRKQMLQYHPDTQPNATEAQKARLVERSKLISEAYRSIKADLKKLKQ
eukprot:scaffold331_cov117-Cylindrotheca_fusiformis.AAC.17